EYENGEKKELEDPELVLRGEKSEEFEAFHLLQSTIDISKEGLLAFVTKAGGTDAIHFYSIDKEAVVLSYQQDNLINITSPKFSSDGNKVVFHAVDQKGFSDLYIYNILQDSLERLTNDYYDERDPSFGVTDDEIMFSSDRTAGRYEKKYNLFAFNINDKRIRYITNLNCNNYSPVISPDKKTLLFTSDYDKVRNIWKMDISEGFNPEIEKVTNFITSSFNPIYLDSSNIAFAGFENFSFNLYTKKLDDTVIVNETVTMEYDSLGEKWEPGFLSAFSEREDLKYEKEYTLDYAQSQVTTDPVFGTRGGAIFSLSDLFGDDNYFFLIYNTAEVQSDLLKSFNVAIHRVNLGGRSNYGYGLFHFSGRRYDIRDSDEYYFERSYGGFFTLHFPISKFQRIETSVSVTNSDKEVISGLIERKALLVSNSISWVHDNSIWGPSGPLDGIRARLLLGYTGDVKFSNVNYFSLIADYRQYFRLGLRTAFALRSALFYNEGKEARRYFMGGSWDLRGWPRWSIRGEKLWLSSLEFRFPLIDQLSIRFPFAGLGFFGIRGALFADAGGAWDTEYKTTLGSVGGGIRFNLFGVLVLRYDIGKKIEKDFTQFQPGLFYQFFFGWDF
ncbi:MAG: BamA/TamA family outer membrane protein, partial [Ignavibacteriaceae bacterium]